MWSKKIYIYIYVCVCVFVNQAMKHLGEEFLHDWEIKNNKFNKFPCRSCGITSDELAWSRSGSVSNRFVVPVCVLCVRIIFVFVLLFALVPTCWTVKSLCPWMSIMSNVQNPSKSLQPVKAPSSCSILFQVILHYPWGHVGVLVVTRSCWMHPWPHEVSQSHPNGPGPQYRQLP